ncbi:Phosphopantetheine adenylyltransferase [Fundidesulfovibrio magnetotacticus]|uniref:Phosphopantetheine adenylyltransferase n=1 Tax=Fundidesulfovibrio magnetotacticus TaxID=2730080 RepID=A0A6V8LS59_9BACT|nr:pantetheine-phosphate adenylyltransferase [Fundidesulfovibrio magnetotacticus]GFK94574.1 Phosphopantetheine adenylyltransferase [Fundidesulfovibrio magnetotacticus]
MDPKRNHTTAVYPGTFDPLTMGHRSLVRRALKVFDRIIVAVARQTPKQTLFTLDERVEMIQEVFAQEERISVEPFHGLLVDYVHSAGASVILRGMRAVSDFDHEFQMALMNRRMDKDIESIFLMTDFKWLYISSTIVKEVAKAGGDYDGLVPEPVMRRLRERFGPGSPRRKHG